MKEGEFRDRAVLGLDLSNDEVKKWSLDGFKDTASGGRVFVADVTGPPTDDKENDDPDVNVETTSTPKAPTGIVLASSYQPEMAKAPRNIFFVDTGRESNDSDSRPAHLSADSATSGDSSALPPPDGVVEYGCLVQNVACSSVAVVGEVLLALLRQSGQQAGSSSSSLAASSLHETHLRKFASRLDHATNQGADGGARLRLPDNVDLIDVDNLVDDYDAMQRLEQCAEEWRDVVASTVDAERQEAKGRLPMDEVEFWRRRRSVLSDLTEQASSPSVRKVLDALRRHGSPVVPTVADRFTELSRLFAEASDNARFLATLERHFRVLQDGTLSAAVSILPALLDAMRMVWTVSRHYNHDDRLVPLMERVAWQLICRVQEHIDCKTILHVDLESAGAVVLEAKQLLEVWREAYTEVRARIEDDGTPQRRWEFDRSRLFERTDSAASVCGEMHECIVAIGQFRHFLESKLSVAIGTSGSIDKVAAQVDNLPRYLSVEVDPFNRGEQWSAAVKEFHKQVEAIEELAGVSIKQAFQQLRSAEQSFNLVVNFSSVHSRPAIHRHIEERYTDILEQYNRELGQLEALFEAGKDDPPKCPSHDCTSGAITWAMDLYDRAKRPILRFGTRDGLLSSGFGDEVKQRYLKFARLVNSHTESLYEEWRGRIPAVTSEGVRQPVLVRVEDGNSAEASMPSRVESSVRFKSEKSVLSGGTKMSSLKRAPRSLKSSASISTRGEGPGLIHNMFGRVLPLASNFPRAVMSLIGEAKHLDQMGFVLPQAALTATLQEETYHGHILDLDEMVKVYNSTLSSLSTVETRMLKDHIKKMDEVLMPGLTTLNWMSQRIPAFVAASSLAIEKFRAILTEVRKHSATIEEVVRRIESSSLIGYNDFVDKASMPMSTSDFSDIVESIVRSRVEGLVRDYRSIQPLMFKVEMSVAESNEGKSPALAAYYTYWEHRVYIALFRMVVRSLVSLLDVVKSLDGRPPICIIGASFKGDELIVAPPFVEIYEELNRCIRCIPESTKSFVRWMTTTCIEMSPLQRDDSAEANFVYSFYDDIATNAAVVGTLVRLNQEVHRVFDEVGNYLKQWRRSGDEQELLETKQEAGELLEFDAPCSFFLSALSKYEELGQAYRASVTAEDAPTDIGLRANHSIGFIHMDCTQVALGMSEKSKTLKVEVSAMFHSHAKKRLDSFTAKCNKLSKDLMCANEESPTDCIEEILNMALDMELTCIDIQERYEILRDADALIPAEEVTSALSVATVWQNMVVNAKTKKCI